MTNKEAEIIKAINEVPYPHYNDIKTAAMEEFEANFVGTTVQLAKARKNVENTAKEQYDKAKKDYNNKISELKDELKELVRDDLGMPKKVFDIVWTKAYEDGHSAGYEEVISNVEELDEFVHNIIDATSAK